MPAGDGTGPLGRGRMNYGRCGRGRAHGFSGGGNSMRGCGPGRSGSFCRYAGLPSANRVEDGRDFQGQLDDIILKINELQVLFGRQETQRSGDGK